MSDRRDNFRSSWGLHGRIWSNPATLHRPSMNSVLALPPTLAKDGARAPSKSSAITISSSQPSFPEEALQARRTSPRRALQTLHLAPSAFTSPSAELLFSPLTPATTEEAPVGSYFSAIFDHDL